jgi:CBS domain-containing protein
VSATDRSPPQEAPALPQNAAKETVGVYPGALRDERYGVAAEEALLAKLQGEMGANMFRRSLRAARQAHPELREGDGEAVYRGYLQASLLAVVSAAFLHPLPSRYPSGVAGALASNHRIGVYDWDPAFDDGSRVADPSTFEIISQSDVVRFLHDRRDDERVRPLLRLSVRRLALLRDASRGEPRRPRPPGDDAAAAEADSEAASERRTRPLSSSVPFGSSSERFGTRFGTHFGTLLPFRGVLCVPSEGVSALDAFALMDAEGVSALGVCDDAYRLVANISVSDLRGLRPETVDRLAMPVEAFLERQRVVIPEKEKGKEKEVSRGGTRDEKQKHFEDLDASETPAEGSGVVTCGVEDTLGAVVERMVTRSVHHVYVCSAEGHPLAVVTPRDVLRLLADEVVDG